MDGTDGESQYVGRLGLTDSSGRRLMLDWRSPAAEPFFPATHANARAKPELKGVVVTREDRA
jgi:DNA helicase IV